jgi:hypothetical protein
MAQLPTWSTKGPPQQPDIGGTRKFYSVGREAASQCNGDPLLQHPCSESSEDTAKAPCDRSREFYLDPFYYLTGNGCPSTHLAHPRPTTARQRWLLHTLL